MRLSIKALLTVAAAMLIMSVSSELGICSEGRTKNIDVSDKPVILTPGYAGDPNVLAETIDVNGQKISFTFPAGYARAPESVADEIRKTIYLADFQPALWVYVKPSGQEKNDDRLLAERIILVLAHSPRNIENLEEFTTVKSLYDAVRLKVAVSWEELWARVLTMATDPAEYALVYGSEEEIIRLIAPSGSGENYTFWLSATDSEASTSEKREFLLTFEGCFYKDGRIVHMNILSLYDDKAKDGAYTDLKTFISENLN